MRNDDADRWRLRSIIDALAKMQPAPAAAPQIDPELAELYMRFDESEAAMKKLKTVDARRKASRTMAPLLAEIGAAWITASIPSWSNFALIACSRSICATLKAATAEIMTKPGKRWTSANDGRMSFQDNNRLATWFATTSLCSSIAPVYANVRRQKSMSLRECDTSTGAVYRNCTTTNLDAGLACSQACLQATFKRVEK